MIIQKGNVWIDLVLNKGHPEVVNSLTTISKKKKKDCKALSIICQENLGHYTNDDEWLKMLSDNGKHFKESRRNVFIIKCKDFILLHQGFIEWVN